MTSLVKIQDCELGSVPECSSHSQCLRGGPSEERGWRKEIGWGTLQVRGSGTERWGSGVKDGRREGS